MIHEEICTYEVCKLAKEKGFNEKVYHYYQIINKHYCECQDSIEPYIFSFKLETDDCFIRYNKVSEDVISAPIQSLLQRWLREEKKIIVEVSASPNEKKEFVFDWVVLWNPLYIADSDIVDSDAYSNGDNYSTYELALEDALKYALENLV